MRFSLLIGVLCLQIFAGGVSFAQGITTEKATSQLVAPNISADGKWMSLRKRAWKRVFDKAGLDADTVVVLQQVADGSLQEMTRRIGVREVQFMKDNKIWFTDPLGTEYLDLITGKQHFFTGVQRVAVLEDGFVLQSGNAGAYQLNWYRKLSKPVQSLEGVVRWYVHGLDTVYAIVQSMDQWQVVRMQEQKLDTVYRSMDAITSLELDSFGSGVMVHQRKAQTNLEGLVYVDLPSGRTYPLAKVFSGEVMRSFTRETGDGKSYELRVRVAKDVVDTSVVDVWYGSDQQLETKFYEPIEEQYYLWEPVNQQLSRMGSDTLTRSTWLGNTRYVLGFNPYKFQTYVEAQPPLEVQVYDRKLQHAMVMDTINLPCYLAWNQAYVLYQKEGNWWLYDAHQERLKSIGGVGLEDPYFSKDGNQVYFGGQGLWRYDIPRDYWEQLLDTQGYTVELFNGVSENAVPGYSFRRRSMSVEAGLLLKLSDSVHGKVSYGKWQLQRYDTLVPPTEHYISQFRYDAGYTHFGYLEEQVNMAPRLAYYDLKTRHRAVYSSEATALPEVRMEVISFTDAHEKPIQGLLYYPRAFDSSQTYPMLVYIYEMQSHRKNRYLNPTDYESQGLDIRRLLDQGYFVYLPDMRIYKERGAGVEALEGIDRALDAVAHVPQIDTLHRALMGHSFGGYETNCIATHSERFATYITGAGVSDLVQDYHWFNTNFLSPDYRRVESGQYRMPVPFGDDPELYAANNPIVSVKAVHNPILLWSGTEDHNVESSQTMAFYNALKRMDKPVVALFYKGEGHNLRSRAAQWDLRERIEDWLAYFLKGDHSADWIQVEMKKDAP